MSRIGKLPVAVPAGVDVKVDGPKDSVSVTTRSASFVRPVQAAEQLAPVGLQREVLPVAKKAAKKKAAPKKAAKKKAAKK